MITLCILGAVQPIKRRDIGAPAMSPHPATWHLGNEPVVRSVFP